MDSPRSRPRERGRYQDTDLRSSLPRAVLGFVYEFLLVCCSAAASGACIRLEIARFFQFRQDGLLAFLAELDPFHGWLPAPFTCFRLCHVFTYKPDNQADARERSTAS